MTDARPRDFEAVGQFETVSVTTELVVEAFHRETVVKVIEADRVLVGGGLPDEAMEVKEDDRRDVVQYLRFEDVDLCRRDDGGDTEVWLAP